MVMNAAAKLGLAQPQYNTDIKRKRKSSTDITALWLITAKRGYEYALRSV